MDDCACLKKAVEYCSDNNQKKVIKSLSLFLKKYPEHLLAEEAKLAIANSLLSLGKYNQAVSLLNDMVYSKGSSQIYDSAFAFSLCSYLQNAKGSCLFLIPVEYVSLQHEACILIAEAGFATKRPYLALSAIINADKYYRRWYGCGTADEQENLRLALLYSRYYKMMNNQDSALKVILPYTLESSAYPIQYYAELLDSSIAMLKRQYSATDIQGTLEAAIEHVEIKPTTEAFREVNAWFIHFFGSDIKVAPVYLYGEKSSPESVKLYIRQTDFYKKLTGKN